MRLKKVKKIFYFLKVLNLSFFIRFLHNKKEMIRRMTCFCYAYHAIANKIKKKEKVNN